jgi:hypothetical protein
MNSEDNNPYASPSIPANDSRPVLPSLSIDKARKQLAVPAYGLGISGVAGMVATCVTIPLILMDAPSDPPYTGFGSLRERVAIAIIQLLLGGGLSFLFIRGALAMRQLRNYSAARWAAIVGTAALGGACALGFPFAIWALALLRDERVRGAFQPEPIRWLPERKPAA